MKLHDPNAPLGINRQGVSWSVLWDEGQFPVHSVESIRCLGLPIGLISHRLTGPCISLYPAQLSMHRIDKHCGAKLWSESAIGVEYCPHIDWQGNGVDSQPQKSTIPFRRPYVNSRIDFQSQNWNCYQRLPLKFHFIDEVCHNDINILHQSERSTESY